MADSYGVFPQDPDDIAAWQGEVNILGGSQPSGSFDLQLFSVGLVVGCLFIPLKVRLAGDQFGQPSIGGWAVKAMDRNAEAPLFQGEAFQFERGPAQVDRPWPSHQPAKWKIALQHTGRFLTKKRIGSFCTGATGLMCRPPSPLHSHLKGLQRLGKPTKPTRLGAF